MKSAGLVCCILALCTPGFSEEETEKPKGKEKKEKEFDGRSIVLEKAFRESLLNKLKHPDPKNPPPLPPGTSEEDWNTKVIDPAVETLFKADIFRVNQEEEKKFKSGKFNNEMNVRRLKLALAKFKDRDSRLGPIAAMFVTSAYTKAKDVELELMMRIAEWDALSLDRRH